MVLHPVHPPDLDHSTICTVLTPPESVATNPPDDVDPFGGARDESSCFSWVPWPGSTFIIRSISSGHMITLLDGQIVLNPPGGSRGSHHWACVETKGWLGFQNPVSGRFLGHDARGNLCCSAGRHQGWENFSVRRTPEGGYLLLMTHFERLWHVGVKEDQGVEKLAKLGDGASDGIVWEFIKV